MMARTPLVTIGLSTHNRADSYLKEALQSALSQTYPNLEVVVSDNASTDHTEALVECCDDPRVRYFRQTKNIGANNNFNFCLEQARGDYFVLLHDDDVIDPDFVAACMDAIGDVASVGIIRTGTRIINAQGVVLETMVNRAGGLSITEFMLEWLASKTALYLCSTVFNTMYLRAIGGFQSKTFLYQDVAAEMRLASRYGRADVPEVKASFRRHGQNGGSAARLYDWVEDSLFVLDVMCDIAPRETRERVRRAGVTYFSRRNYHYVRAISPLSKRLKAYYVVYRKFGYAYSPIRYLAGRYLRGLKRRIGG